MRACVRVRACVHCWGAGGAQEQLQGVGVKQAVKALFALRDDAIDTAAEHIIVQARADTALIPPWWRG